MMKIDDKILAILNKEPVKEKDGRLYFIESKKFNDIDKELSGGINWLKTFLKKWPWLYNFLQVFLTPAYSPIRGLTPKKAIKSVFTNNLKEKTVINIGSGTKRILPEVINSDIYPFENVDIIADLRELPFRDNSVDMVILDAVLEHVPSVENGIKEVKRIIKSGGYIYINVPFLYPFHASPNDYKRWTIEGLKSDFSEFRAIKTGMKGGPFGTLQGVLMHIFAILLSFRIEKLYLFWSQFFMVLFSPLKLLDVIFLIFPFSHEVSSHIFFFGQKA